MKGIDFYAVDVETANPDRATICQIGVAAVRGNRIVDTWGSLVDPQAAFEPSFVGIHGIDESSVKGKPTLPELWNELSDRLYGEVLVSHTAFDRTAFGHAAERHGLHPLSVVWLDSAHVARRAWPKKYRRRWSLRLIANDLGIEFRHHDALEDAVASAKIVIHARRVTGYDIADWVDNTR